MTINQRVRFQQYNRRLIDQSWQPTGYYHTGINQWHESKLYSFLTTEPFTLSEVDELFTQATELNPIKCTWISCQIQEEPSR